jgi:RNA polymerase-binding transcription factor DksA
MSTACKKPEAEARRGREQAVSVDYAVAVALDDSERLALFDQVEADLKGVSAVMERLDAGTYDACEVCGNPLSEERLTAEPLSARCETCFDRVS